MPFANLSFRNGKEESDASVLFNIPIFQRKRPLWDPHFCLTFWREAQLFSYAFSRLQYSVVTSSRFRAEEARRVRQLARGRKAPVWMRIKVGPKEREGKGRERETMQAIWLSLKETLRCTVEPGEVLLPEKLKPDGGRGEFRAPRNGGDHAAEGDASLTRDVVRRPDPGQNKFCDLSVGDTSRNIIEMIFRATWLSPGSSIGKIERVLKVNNSPETLERLEQYRETVKSRAEMLQQQKGNPRSVADGNELLRFHSTTMACCPALTEKLSGLCRNAQCGVCRVIQSGFTTEEMKRNGIRMTATGVTGEELLVSKKAEGGIRVKRAVVVCRVIAGRVLSVSEGGSYVGGDGGFDSLVVKGGLCSKWGDLYVSNPSAVLPCFVIVYSCKPKAV